MGRALTFVLAVVISSLIATTAVSWMLSAYQAGEKNEKTPRHETESSEQVQLPSYALKLLSLMPPDKPSDKWKVYNGSGYELISISVRIEWKEFDKERFGQLSDSYVERGFSVEEAFDRAAEESYRNGGSRYYDMAVVHGGSPSGDAVLDGPTSLLQYRCAYTITKASGYATERSRLVEGLADDLLSEMANAMNDESSEIPEIAGTTP